MTLRPSKSLPCNKPVSSEKAPMFSTGPWASVTVGSPRKGTPKLRALVINGRIVCVGTVPDRNRIRQWLIDLKASGECKAGV